MPERTVVPSSAPTAPVLVAGSPPARWARRSLIKLPRPANDLADADCRHRMRDRLTLLDEELARLAADPRDAAHTARLIMTADRNGHADRCRACGRCPLARAPITDPLPTP